MTFATRRSTPGLPSHRRPRPRDRVLGDVDADELVAELREHARERAAGAADLERSPVPRPLEQLALALEAALVELGAVEVPGVLLGPQVLEEAPGRPPRRLAVEAGLAQPIAPAATPSATTAAAALRPFVAITLPPGWVAAPQR